MAKTVQKKARGKNRFGVWLKAQLALRPRPVWIVIVTDVLIFAVALNAFALLHHVLPRSEKSVDIVSERVRSVESLADDAHPEAIASGEASTQADAPTASGEGEVQTEAVQEPVQSDPVGVFSIRFADKFTDGEVISDSNNYRSQNLNITITKYQEPELVYYVADVYMRRIDCLRTAFAKDSFGRGRWEWLRDMSRRLNGIIAVNGDYYGGRSDGVVLRNGKLYRNDKNILRDVCVINWDGTMETYRPEEWDTYRAIENGAYQVWNFGPILLDENGNAKETFQSEITGRNPRTAIGYYEPGHYCFVVVDGRSKDSRGITLVALSQLMQRLGCSQAYNFDGGKSSEMVVNHEVISNPYEGGRKGSDGVVIVDE